jgi:ribonuclease HI
MCSLGETYKLNVDTSFYVDDTGAAGAILRNYKGGVIGGMYCPLENVLNAATAEALSLLRGLEFLERFGCSKVLIESNSVELIQCCNGTIEVWIHMRRS